MAFGTYDSLNSMYGGQASPLTPPGIDLAANMPEKVRPTSTKTKPKAKPKAKPKTGVNMSASGTGDNFETGGQVDLHGQDIQMYGDQGTPMSLPDIGEEQGYNEPYSSPVQKPNYNPGYQTPMPLPLPPTPTVPTPAPLDPPPHYLPPMPPMNLPPFPPMPPMLPEISFEPMEMPERKPYGFASVDSRAAGYSQALPGSGTLRDRVMGSVGRTPLQNALQ